jgi:hypothetical protein
MIALFTTVDWHPALWLAVFCGPLLAVVLALGCMPRRHDDIGEIRLGNPLLRGENHALPPAAQPMPLVHLCRTLGDAGLHPLVIGMRHLPLHETAPILRRQLKSLDPELQLYAQCVLQEGQAALQNRFQALAQKAIAGKSPAILASFLEAALSLLRSPLTPVSEHAITATKVQEILSPRLEELNHPRALHAAAMYFLQLKQPGMAAAMHARLPVGSPLHTDLTPRIAHVAAIQNPPPPVGTGYQMT